MLILTWFHTALRSSYTGVEITAFFPTS